jgi:hypothetical protein
MKHEVRIIGMPAAGVLISGVSVSAFEMNSTNYAISGVSDSAGGFSNSTNYSAVSAVGEPAVSYSNSASFQFVFRDIFKQFIKDSLLI